LPTINIRKSEPRDFKFAQGLLTHYKVMTDEDYKSL